MTKRTIFTIFGGVLIAIIGIFLLLSKPRSTSPIRLTEVRNEVKVLKPGTREEVTTINIELTPVRIVEKPEKGSKAAGISRGTLEIEGTVYDLEATTTIETIEIEEVRTSWKLLIRAPVLGEDGRLAWQPSLGIGYEFKIPILGLKVWPAASFRGVSLNIPSYITKNTAVFIGAGQGFNEKPFIQAGIGVTL